MFKRASTSFSGTGTSSHPGWTKDAFINLDHAQCLFFLRYLVAINELSKNQEISVNGLSVQLQQQSGFGSVNIDTKTFYNFSDFVST